MMKIFLTGGTGFIGEHLLPQIIDAAEIIYVLSRREKFNNKLQAILNHPKIKMVKGNIGISSIADDYSIYKEIIENVDTVIHMAATYDLEVSYSDSYFSNVIGTRNICALCQKAKKLKTFHYISTVAVSGDFEGKYLEDQLPTSKHFNYYSHTKYLAEDIVRNTQLPGITTRIYRPGIVTGNSQSGDIQKIDGPYYFFKFLYKLSQKPLLVKLIPFVPIPYKKEVNLPIIPINNLVQLLSQLIKSPKGDEKIKCYHLIPKILPKVDQILKDSSQYFGIRRSIIAIKYVPILDTVFKYLKIPSEIIPYLNIKCDWSTDNLSKDYPEIDEINYIDYAPIFFEGGKRYFQSQGKTQ